MSSLLEQVVGGHWHRATVGTFRTLVVCSFHVLMLLGKHEVSLSVLMASIFGGPLPPAKLGRFLVGRRGLRPQRTVQMIIVTDTRGRSN